MTDEEWKLCQFISEDEATLQCLILVNYGIPYDVAFSLSDIQRFAYIVVFKQAYENLVFDWNSRTWKERPKRKVIGGKI